MSTYPSPVTVADFQKYMRDATTDTEVLSFFQSILDSATEQVYTYLGRDYTPSAVKTDVFFGKGLHIHRMDNPAGTIINWKSYDFEGTETINDISGLVLISRGAIVVNPEATFAKNLEHRIKYALPDSLSAPETVCQVILEIAAIVFEESKLGGARLGIEIESDHSNPSGTRVKYLDLRPRHVELLAPYRRVAV
ncbi:MAG: hypothetical protein WCH46_07105 [bacterium]